MKCLNTRAALTLLFSPKRPFYHAKTADHAGAGDSHGLFRSRLVQQATVNVDTENASNGDKSGGQEILG